MYAATLETPRLILKGLSPATFTYIFEHFDIEKIKEILGHQTEKDFLTEESKQKNGYASYNRTFILFLLIEKESQKVIGRCGIHNWNVEHRRAEIGYQMTDEAYKNKGFMTEAVEVIIAYGFGKLNLNRLEALVGSTNIPSLRLMQKFGFVQEGLLRQHVPAGDTFVDSILFSLLQEEYSSVAGSKT
jgi:[ribosomal protein S5]-alanine N-acetyltransferase